MAPRPGLDGGKKNLAWLVQIWPLVGSTERYRVLWWSKNSPLTWSLNFITVITTCWCTLL